MARKESLLFRGKAFCGILYLRRRSSDYNRMIYFIFDLIDKKEQT
jgi:hypothetical protein